MKSYSAISLDIDNLWSYLKTHGDPGWKTFPSYYHIFIPYILDILNELNIKITFFIVGKDATISSNLKYIKMITENGHEVGNHSFNHEPWLHLLTKEQIFEEITMTENAIHQVTGTRPVGFRGPGFSWSHNLLEVLFEKNYLYDASTLPTFIGPLARIYYFWTSNLDKEAKKQRKKLFGTLKDGLMPGKPFFWLFKNNNRLLEIPVTTLPFFKIPFHLSYLLYLYQYSEKLMQIYLNLAIHLCRITRTEPSFLLHPLDLLGSDLVPGLSFFPGMRISSAQKLYVFKKIINLLSENFTLTTMNSFAELINKNGKINVKKF